MGTNPTIYLYDGNPQSPTPEIFPYGWYVDDQNFIEDAVKVCRWCATKLGYPVIDIELPSASFYVCFEEAVYTYTAEINKFILQNHYFDVLGTVIPNDIQEKDLFNINIDSSMHRIIKLSKQYANETTGISNDKKIYSASIDVKQGVQKYDLNTILPDSDRDIEIIQVYHTTPPAIAFYYDPLAGVSTRLGIDYMMSQFGWSGMSPGVRFLMLPLFDDIIRLQHLEFDNMVRRSAYSFKLENNVLSIFPIPTYDKKVWIEYTYAEERVERMYEQKENLQTNPANTNFKIIQYSKLNQFSKQWIYNYTLALVKELLGTIRSKYDKIPIPGKEVTLDGEKLRDEGKEMKKELIEGLREALGKMSYETILDVEKKENDTIQDILVKIPLPMFFK